jgi:hypothetical protein
MRRRRHPPPRLPRRRLLCHRAPENVPPPASKGAIAPEASKASKELKERLAAAEKRLADETAASAAKDAMHRREHIEALELQSALERQITALTKELHHLKRKAAQPPTSSPKPLTTDQDTAATAAAAAVAPGTSTGAQASAISLAAAVPPLAVTDEQLRTPSPSQGSNAMARIKVLERQLAEANAKLSAQALLHRKEISRLFEERKQMEALMLQSGRDKSPGTRLPTAADDGAATAGTGGATSRRTGTSATAAAAAATGAGASSSRTGATRMRAEAQAAATEVLLREQIAKLQRDLASKQTEADKVRTRDAEIAALRAEADEHRAKASDLLNKLKVSEALRTGVATATGAIATLRELRHHKFEMLAVEQRLDDARLELHRRQAEVDDLTRRAKSANEELEKLRADNASLRAGATPASDEAAAKAATMGKAHAKRVAELEDQLLKKDGALLDLRFERETLALRVGRLERHVEELVATERRESQITTAMSPQRPISPRNGGATPRQGGGAGAAAAAGGNTPGAPYVAKASDMTRIAQLEGVVENMKTVIEKLHKENALLKATGVSGSRYQEVAREVKFLRQRERDLMDAIQQLNVKLAHAQTMRADPTAISQQGRAVVHDQTAMLQRRLRAAEAAADRYRSEADRYKEMARPLDIAATAEAAAHYDVTATATGTHHFHLGAMPPAPGETPLSKDVARFPEILLPEHWEHRLHPGVDEASQAPGLSPLSPPNMPPPPTARFA